MSKDGTLTVAELIAILETVQRKDAKVLNSDGVGISSVMVHHDLVDDTVEVLIDS